MLSPSNSVQIPEDSMDDGIKNFFVSYHLTDKKERFKKYLPLLMDRNFQEKVRIQDDELKIFINSYNKSVKSKSPISLSLHFVNRVLLHALIFKPEITTIIFDRAFVKVAKYIIKISEKNITGSVPTEDHFENCYFDFIDEMNYFISCYTKKRQPDKFKNVQYQRPVDMIVLPYQVETPLEWYNIAIKLDQPALVKTYHQQSGRIEKIFFKNPDLVLRLLESHELGEIIKTFPIRLEYALRIILVSIDDHLHNHILANLVSEMELFTILGALPDKSLINLIKCSDGLANIIHRAPLPILTAYLHSLPSKQRIALLQTSFNWLQRPVSFSYVLTLYAALPKANRNTFLDMLSNENFTQIVLNHYLVYEDENNIKVKNETKLFTAILKYYCQKFSSTPKSVLAALKAAPIKIRAHGIAGCDARTFEDSFNHPFQILDFMEMFPIADRYRILEKQIGMTHILDVTDPLQLLNMHSKLDKAGAKQFMNAITPTQAIAKANENAYWHASEFLLLYISELDEVKQNIFIAYNSAEFFQQVMRLSSHPTTLAPTLEKFNPANKYLFLEKVLPITKGYSLLELVPLLKQLTIPERKQFISQCDENYFEKICRQDSFTHPKIPALFDIKPSDLNKALSSLPLKQRILHPRITRTKALHNIITDKHTDNLKPANRISWLKYLIPLILIAAIAIGAGIAAGLPLLVGLCVSITLIAAMTVAITYSTYTRMKATQRKEAEIDNQITQSLSTTSSLSLVLLNRDNVPKKDRQHAVERPLRSGKYSDIGVGGSIFSRRPINKVVVNDSGRLAWNRGLRGG